MVKKQDLHIVINGLSMAKRQDGQWECEDLQQIPTNAEAIIRQKKEELEINIRQYVEAISKAFYCKNTDDMSDEERIEKTQQKLAEVLPAILEQMNMLPPFERLLAYTNTNWWYYGLMAEGHAVRWGDGNEACDQFREYIARDFLIPALPENVRMSLKDYELINTAVNGSHFALYFNRNVGFSPTNDRKIVTDRQLFQLNNVHGYNYLDVQYNGMPLIRSRTDHYGDTRTFFDGVRYMTHKQFRTCAPPTTLLPTGYMVNSTRCTIINGLLYKLIATDDQVAYSTGMPFHFAPVNYSFSDKAASIQINKKAASKIEIVDEKIYYEGKLLKPLGIFSSSSFKLTEEGFMLFEPAQYIENNVYRYDHIMVVDDKGEWIRKVQDAFGEQLEKGVHLYQTQDKFQAVQDILRVNPEVVLLDMHLTEHEEFDGLYIARELAKMGFKGQVWICSSYGEDTLQQFLSLLGNAAQHAPGKNIEKIDTLLRKAE